MPELPEVEVLRRSLEPHIVGLTVGSVRVRNSNLREVVNRRQLQRCRNRKILAVRRRAKYLLVGLTGGQTLVIHLGMSGRLTLVSGSVPAETHEHVWLDLSSGQRLRFCDPRRFGLVFARATRGLMNDSHFVHLGIEPLEDAFDGSVLRSLAQGRRAPVKSFLMDGRLVVGVGNIYAAEALYRSGIHPARSVARISEDRWHQLALAVRETLAEAIDQGGTTLNDFADGLGETGYFKVSLAVYDRQGKECPRCQKTVRRIVQSGRSTFYCPGCQH